MTYILIGKRSKKAVGFMKGKGLPAFGNRKEAASAARTLNQIWGKKRKYRGTIYDKILVARR